MTANKASNEVSYPDGYTPMTDEELWNTWPNDQNKTTWEKLRAIERAVIARLPKPDTAEREALVVDAERWRAMRKSLVAADFAPEMGGGPVVIFECHAERVGFGPEGADAIADAAIRANLVGGGE